MQQQPYGYPPHGPYQPPPKRGMSPVAIIAIVVGCMFGGCMVLGVIGSMSKPHDSASSTTTAAPAATTKTAAPKADDEAPATAVPVSAKRLVADYDKNEIRGDAAWKGKYVEVTGTVESIDKGPFGGLYVVLGDGESFHSVHVDLKKSEVSSAAALNKGDTATFRGKVLGYVLGSVSVRDAVMVSGGGK